MKVEVNNVFLNYEKSGKGQPLLFLHGNGEDHHIFDKLTSKMEKHFTIYSIDSRNHGESEKTDDYSYETMTEDIYRFIRKTELENVSVAGFSDGAIIALLLAMDNKNIFNKMVLMGVNLRPTDFKKSFYEYLAHEYEKSKDPFIKMMLEQPDIKLEELKNIHIPTLVIAAQYDLFYRRMFKDIVATMPDARLKVMQGHDHDSYITNNDLLYTDLVEFLS